MAVGKQAFFGILKNFDMMECNPVKTPLPRDLNLSLMDSREEVDPKLQSVYRAIVGSMMYLYQWTRPDLGFTVTKPCQYIFISLNLHQHQKHLNHEKQSMISGRDEVEMRLHPLLTCF